MLLAKLKKDYNIPTANFIGHGDIAPKRKADPSILFPWDVLAKNGFGLYSGYKTFYYRPGQSDLFKLIYQTEPTGSQSWLMDYEMSKLITTVCSNISTEAADAAQNNFLNPIANK